MSSEYNRPSRKDFARRNRHNPTRSEGLLWGVLRAKQLCGLKFRRQHPIENWIVDFACVRHMLVVEIDGGYHDAVVDEDLRRQRKLEELGWTVLRFTDKDVEEDAEAVGIAIAKHLGLDYQFMPRKRTGSGMKSNKLRTPPQGVNHSVDALHPPAQGDECGEYGLRPPAGSDERSENKLHPPSGRVERSEGRAENSATPEKPDKPSPDVRSPRPTLPKGG